MIKDDVVVHKGIHLDKNTSLCKNKWHSPQKETRG
jgi:hypothetical protein